MKKNFGKVYLAGSISGATDSEANDWRDWFTSIWNWGVKNPMRRDYRGVEHQCTNEIVVLDKLDIRDSEIVLVRFDKPSVGTSMEVFYAYTLEKPVILWCDKTAVLSPWLTYHSTVVVHTKEEVVGACYRFLS